MRILTALVVLLCLALSLPAHAQRPGAKKIKPTPGHAITDVTDPVRAGRKAQRFELRAGDCGGPCTDDREWAMLRRNKTWRYGTAQWIGFSVYVPADFAASPPCWWIMATVVFTRGLAAKSAGTCSRRAAK